MEQALALMRSDMRPSQRPVAAGYLDLLGEDGGRRRYAWHRGFDSRVVPFSYEWFVHPVAMRLVGGLRAPGRRAEQRIALEMLAPRADDCILDVGCGPGNFTRSYAAASGEGLIVGLDMSATMLAAAVRRTRAANVAYMRGDGCSLPFQDSSFDAVSCFGAMHLFEEPLRGLAEMVRVLAPDGRMALLVPCRHGRAAPQRDGWHVFEREEIATALRGHGFTQIEERFIRGIQMVAARKPA
jgi:ubiquinone/menaquinone biosynthesis C-methylase UbiE